MKRKAHKWRDKIKVKDHGEIVFEIEKVKETSIFHMGKWIENTYYDVRGKSGLLIENVPHSHTIEIKQIQPLDELLDTYNSFLMLEEIYKDGYYREEAEIVMETIRELY